jgi:hypothetical protein
MKRLEALARACGAEMQRALRELVREAPIAAGPSHVERGDSPELGPLPGLAIVVPIRGVVAGTFALLFELPAARALCSALGASGTPDDSKLLEVGNILASGFANAAASLMNGPVVPGLPEARRGTLGDLAAELAREAGPAWCLRSVVLTSAARADAIVWLEEGAAELVRAVG